MQSWKAELFCGCVKVSENSFWLYQSHLQIHYFSKKNGEDILLKMRRILQDDVHRLFKRIYKALNEKNIKYSSDIIELWAGLKCVNCSASWYIVVLMRKGDLYWLCFASQQRAESDSIILFWTVENRCRIVDAGNELSHTIVSSFFCLFSLFFLLYSILLHWKV